MAGMAPEVEMAGMNRGDIVGSPVEVIKIGASPLVHVRGQRDAGCRPGRVDVTARR